MTQNDRRTPEVRQADEDIADDHERWIVRDPVTGWTDHLATKRLRSFENILVEVTETISFANVLRGQTGKVVGVGRTSQKMLLVELDDSSKRIVELAEDQLRVVTGSAV
jgi:hypothetical protein